MFTGVTLDQEQKDLLSILVESARNLSRDKREIFSILPTAWGETRIMLVHPGLPNGTIEVYPGDIDILARIGFLLVSHHQPYQSFDITPEGYAYYQQLKHQSQRPVERISSEIKTYIDSDIFKRKYPIAYQKWIEAETMLWATDSEKQSTTIGHLCREAIQKYANVLVNQYKITEADVNKANVINRIRAVLDHQKSLLGKTEEPFLNALLNYWGTISDLIQRQEHGSQKEKAILIWEDSRRAIFQTLIVMYEIDRALSRKPASD